jgi:hypothetical protein
MVEKSIFPGRTDKNEEIVDMNQITSFWQKNPKVAQAFSVEQRQLIADLINEILTWYKFHTEDDSEPHPKAFKSIAEPLDKLEAKFRNHRHETGKTFSAKPDF